MEVGRVKGFNKGKSKKGGKGKPYGKDDKGKGKGKSDGKSKGKQNDTYKGKGFKGYGKQDGQGKGKGGSGAAGPKPQLPDGCVTHDEDKRPLCFAYQSGKCKFKGPAGKRCARGYHKCYKKGCYRPKPYYLCNHSD